jgi:hypothetical protein
MQNLDSHFAILGLPSGASVADVRAAHKRLVVLCHPDRVADNPTLKLAAEAHTKRLNAARDEILRAIEDAVVSASASGSTSADSSPRVDPDPSVSGSTENQQRPISAIEKLLLFAVLCIACYSVLMAIGGFDHPTKPEQPEPRSELATIEKICALDIMNARNYIDNPQEDVLVALKKYALATERLAVEAKGLFYHGMSFGIVVREYSDTLNKVYSVASSDRLLSLSRMEDTLPALVAKIDALRARMMEFGSGSPSVSGDPHSAIRPSVEPRAQRGGSSRAS